MTQSGLSILHLISIQNVLHHIPKGEVFLDGGFSNNQPVIEDMSTVRVSPFAGPSQISPKDNTHPSGKKINFHLGMEEMEMSYLNMLRALVAIWPSENLQSLYDQGYRDTEDFIKSGQIKQLLIHPKIKAKKVRNCMVGKGQNWEIGTILSSLCQLCSMTFIFGLSMWKNVLMLIKID